MSAQGSSATLAQAIRILNLEWDKAKTHWRDAKAQEFEHKYLEELPGMVAAALTAMEEVEQVLKKVRSDCE